MGYINKEIQEERYNDIIELTGEVLTYKDIVLCREAQPFFVLSDDGGKTELSPVNIFEFNMLYELWENYRYFGLPNGRGWQHELPETIKILKSFIKTEEQVKFDIEQKELNKSQKSRPD